MGEFQNIIDALTEELLAKSSSEYLKVTLEEVKEIFTGREGYISEWRDFLTAARFMLYRIKVEGMKE